MTPATAHPPAPESALRPLGRAALCLPALLAASTFVRLQIIPLCIAFFYSRVGLGQLGTLLVIIACLCGADSFCLRRLLGWVRGGFPLLAGVVILTGILSSLRRYGADTCQACAVSSSPFLSRRFSSGSRWAAGRPGC